MLLLNITRIKKIYFKYRLSQINYHLNSFLFVGTGVEEENFQALTLKHHTSKLRDYSDLIGVSTFGFRGEALSSLCALSKVTITTRHKNDELGTKIEFDHNGLIIKKTPCSRQVGTTVLLVNIFYTLPVRQKEFHKNIKREFNKMTQLLYAYCLISTHAKIMCTNQNKGYGRTIIVSTQANSTLRDNIVNIFGSQQNQNLLEIKPLNTYIAESADVMDIENGKCQKSPFQIEGVISSCAHGAGRSAPDRQFYYINSRPCEPTKIMKVVNEVYKQFNGNQNPFVFLNIKMENQDVDVNVTPDKRQIFLNHEKVLTTLLKQALMKLFENIPGTMKLQNKLLDASNFNQSTFTKNALHNLEKPNETGKCENSSLKRKMSFLERFANDTKQIKLSSENDNSTIINTAITDIKTPNLSSDSEDEAKGPTTPNFKPMDKIAEETSDYEDKSNIQDFKVSLKNNPIFMPKNINVFHEKDEVDEGSYNEKKFNVTSKINPIDVSKETNECKEKSLIEKVKNEPKLNLVFNPKIINEFSEDDLNKGQDFKDSDAEYSLDQDESSCELNIEEKSNTSDESIQCKNKTKVSQVKKDNDLAYNKNRPKVEMKCSLEDIKQRMQMQEKSKEVQESKLNRIKFRSEITPSSNETAEKELEREISKEMFSKMTIIGQFNLGFIIVQLEDDLFIIDQHASDEKYNFENLEKTTTLVNQKLVVPQTLELTAMNESILLDNLEVFERNGFKFEIDKEAVTTKRVKLSAIPMSKNFEFGKEDIDELLFMLQDSSGDNSTCRPSRVRSMLASRACRKSVMVGSPMTRADMRKLVDNMGTMEQPWNCPHGRPTMRHLVNLFLLKKGSEQ